MATQEQKSKAHKAMEDMIDAKGYCVESAAEAVHGWFGEYFTLSELIENFKNHGL